MFAKISLIFVSVTIAVPAFAVEVTREVEVDAPAAEVWESIGPYCSIGEWHPGIDSCAEEMIDGANYRRLVTSDGAQFLERYVEVYSDLAYGYQIVEGPLPVKDHESVFKVKDLGDTSLIAWSCTFVANGASDKEAADIMGAIFETGLDALKVQFAASH